MLLFPSIQYISAVQVASWVQPVALDPRATEMQGGVEPVEDNLCGLYSIDKTPDAQPLKVIEAAS